MQLWFEILAAPKYFNFAELHLLNLDKKLSPVSGKWKK